MAKKRVNATRMELLRLRRRTQLAKKGHKLLKDKLDGLIQQLLKVVKEHGRLSKKLEQELIEIFQKLVLSSAQIRPEVLIEATKLSECKTNVDITLKNLMGVKIPKHELKIEGDPISYPFSETTGELDQSLTRFKVILEELVKLAEYNKTILIVASHIIEIKRRVNALEYVLIPELEESVRFIKMKLAEIERSNTVSLLKIKDIVRAR
ncbi:MAG: V-type ATP synthase subunit D [Candidatus Margulisiibacteriota bacterium]|nr:V-type ATP synthase subunit D [Candidatus Margulisiibacteriota bacterium]